MVIKDITEHEVRHALDLANREFAGNLTFKRLEFAGRTREGGNKYRVTLAVNSSRAKGARIGFHGQRIAAACWHAHGHFMDALPAGTTIETTCGQSGTTIVHAGDSWYDYQVGSLYQPRYMSDMCDCGCSCK